MQEKNSMHIFISFDYPTNQTLNSTVLKKKKKKTENDVDVVQCTFN